jgi:hypothetical protein
MLMVENPSAPSLPVVNFPEITQRWSWEIVPDHANVAVARHLVEEVASTLLNDDAVHDLVLATSEVVTNSIKIDVANGIGQLVQLSLTRVGDSVTLTCVDHNGQTPEARWIPPLECLHYHMCRRPGHWSKRDWKRWRRRNSLGRGIPLTDELSRNNGGSGFVLVRDGSQVRATLTMKVGAHAVVTSNLADIFAADIAALVA